MKRHSIGTVAVVAAVVLTATACAPSSEPAGSDDVNLVVWGWYSSDADTITDDIFSVFEKSHPGITVEYRGYPSDGYETTLSTGLAASGGPDVVQLQAYGILQKHIEADTLVALDETTVPDLASFSDVLLDGARGSEDGEVYGVPFAIQTAHIFYNKDIFDEHGLSVPTTWDEFTDVSDKLLAAGVTPLAWNFKDTWETPLYQEIFGANIYGGADFQSRFLAGDAKFTDPEYVASLDVLNDLTAYLPSGFSALSYSDATTLFASGQAAMVPDGIWNVGSFKDVAPDLNVGFFPAPLGPTHALDEPVTTTYVDGSFGINRRSEHQEEALELINWMATVEFGQLYSDVLGQLSAVPGVEMKDPLLQQALQAAEESPSPYLCYAKLNGGSPACDQLMSENIQQMLLGNITAQQAAENLQQGIDQWFEPK